MIPRHKCCGKYAEMLSHNAAISRESGVTILEVLASAVVILLGLGAIFGMNAQSLQILRKAQQAAAASQILQERIESMRTHAWPDVSRGLSVAGWMNTPANSAPDLADASPVETLTVSPTSSPSYVTLNNSTFQVERRNGVAKVLQDADLSGERLLLVDFSITWREQNGTQQRRLRAIVGRDGLTRSGIFGSAFGRFAESGQSSPP